MSEDKSSFFYYGAGVFLSYYFTDAASLFGLAPRALGGVEFLLAQPQIALYLEPQLGYTYFPSEGSAASSWGCNWASTSVERGEVRGALIPPVCS
ncbi:MAG: hypothetical protein C4333_01220 [Meiothermus sp.]